MFMFTGHRDKGALWIRKKLIFLFKLVFQMNNTCVDIIK